MAYIGQDQKKAIHDILKGIIPANWKWSLSIEDCSSIHLWIKQGPEWLLTEKVERPHYAEPEYLKPQIVTYREPNHYCLEGYFAEGEHLDLMEKIQAALDTGNWRDNDEYADYPRCGHYTHIDVGRWDRPFVAIPEAEKEAVN